MKRRTILLSTSTVLAGAGLLSGTGAFSSTEVDRDVTVNVANDKRAYLTLTTDESGEATVGLAGSDTRFEAPQPIVIENRLTEAVRVTIKPESDDVTVGTTGLELAPGEAGNVVVDVSGSGAVDAVLTITAEGEGVFVSVTRTLELERSTRIDPLACEDVIGAVKDGRYQSGENGNVRTSRASYDRDSGTVDGFLYVENDGDVAVSLDAVGVNGALVVNAAGSGSIDIVNETVRGDVCIVAKGSNADVDVDMSSGGHVDGALNIETEGDVDIDLSGDRNRVGGDIGVENEGDIGAWDDIDDTDVDLGMPDLYLS